MGNVFCWSSPLIVDGSRSRSAAASYLEGHPPLAPNKEDYRYTICLNKLRKISEDDTKSNLISTPTELGDFEAK